MFGSALSGIAIGPTKVIVVPGNARRSIRQAVEGLFGVCAQHLGQAVRRVIPRSAALSANVVLGPGPIAAAYDETA